MSCPINYEWDRCSSKEYGLTCETCVHWKEKTFHMSLTDILKHADELGIRYEMNSEGGFYITNDDGTETKVSSEQLLGLE